MHARLLRWATAPLIAIALAGCETESTGLGINLVSDAQVQEMAQPAWQKLRAETPESTNATYKQAARNVSNRLLAAAGHDPSKWEVVVFQGKDANAFALPNAKIGVYEGMFNTAENEAQLAAVLGHEIAHVEEKHSAERVNSQMATELGVQAAGALLGASAGGNPEMVAGLLGAGAQYGLILPYGRNQELEADRLGLILMAKAGYDPRQSINLWQNMGKAGGAAPPTFLSTHPGHEQRIAQLQQLMPQALAQYRPR
jgi:predicted Zn-dependent protease